jgi:hypothetical protein
MGAPLLQGVVLIFRGLRPLILAFVVGYSPLGEDGMAIRSPRCYLDVRDRLIPGIEEGCRRRSGAEGAIA